MNVLDIGCGIRAPTSILFNSLGAKVVGIDVEVLTRGVNSAKYQRVLKTQGFKRLLLRLSADLYYDRIYYRELQKRADFPLDFRNVEFVEIDASQAAFKEAFDLIVSNAAFEHMKNLDATLEKMKAAMKQNALAHIEIHLFPSLTGGHNVLWSNPDTQEVVLGRVPPWDHIREQRFPIDFSLNKLRESDYYKLFSKHFEILSWITEYTEPEHYLTPEIKSELSEYSQEELLKRAIVVIARKA